tara:strand:- start:107 stop:229 length:123 start_codon:yes stop_codon:yes gene_type:complete
MEKDGGSLVVVEEEWDLIIHNLQVQLVVVLVVLMLEVVMV